MIQLDCFGAFPFASPRVKPHVILADELVKLKKLYDDSVLTKDEVEQRRKNCWRKTRRPVMSRTAVAWSTEERGKAASGNAKRPSGGIFLIAALVNRDGKIEENLGKLLVT